MNSKQQKTRLRNPKILKIATDIFGEGIVKDAFLRTDDGHFDMIDKFNRLSNQECILEPNKHLVVEFIDGKTFEVNMADQRVLGVFEIEHRESK